MTVLYQNATTPSTDSITNYIVTFTAIAKDVAIKVKDISYKIESTAKEIIIEVHEIVRTTKLPPIIVKINFYGTVIEKIFNIAGCMPFLGVASGGLRAFAGKIQIFAGAILVGIGEIGNFVGTHTRVPIPEMLKKWETLTKIGTEHIIHGCLNVLRGTGEAFIGSMSFGLANVILLVPNVTKQEHFAPYFLYGTLTNDRIIPSTGLETRRY